MYSIRYMRPLRSNADNNRKENGGIKKKDTAQSFEETWKENTSGEQKEKEEETKQTWCCTMPCGVDFLLWRLGGSMPCST